MLKELKKCIKLLKYDDSSILPPLFVYISFLVAGLYLLLTTKMMFLGSALILLAPSMLACYFISFSRIECIAASPRKNLFQLYLPNGMMLTNTLFTYVALSVIISLRASESSRIYSIYYENDFFITYFTAIFTMILIILMLPVVYRYSLGGIAIIAAVFALSSLGFIFIGNLLDMTIITIAFSFQQMLANITNKYTAYLIAGFFLILVASILTFKFNMLVKILKNLGIDLYGKHIKRRNHSKHKSKWIAAIAIIAIIAVFGLYTYMDMQTADGMYDYKDLNNQWKDLMVDCGETMEVFGFEVTIDKYYFDTTTADGCCMLTFKAPEKLDLTEHIDTTSHNDSFFISMPNSKYYDMDKEHDYRQPMTLDTIRVSLSHAGTIEAEYKVSPVNPNEAIIYMYMNLEPDYDSPVCLNFESQDTFDNWREDSIKAYYNDENKIYPEYEYKSFELQDTFFERHYEKAGHIIAVSPTSLVVDSEYDITKLSLLFDDDKKMDIQSDTLADGVEKSVTADYTKYTFYETIDVSKLPDIDITFGEKNVNSNADEKVISVSDENAYLKKDFSYEIFTHFEKDGERNQELWATMDFQWTQMPKYRETDYIHINWHELNFNYDNDGYYPQDVYPNAKDYSVKVTQRVYEEDTSGDKEGRWIETELEEYVYDSWTINEFTSVPIKSGTYSTRYWQNGLSIMPKIYEDTKEHTYTNQTITVEMVFLYSDDYPFDNDFDTPIISCQYYHTTLNVDGKASANDLTASYYSGTIGRRTYYIIEE